MEDYIAKLLEQIKPWGWEYSPASGIILKHYINRKEERITVKFTAKYTDLVHRSNRWPMDWADHDSVKKRLTEYINSRIETLAEHNNGRL